MELKKIDHDLTVCKVESEKELDLKKEFYFVGKTGEEISLVCITENMEIWKSTQDLKQIMAMIMMRMEL